MESSTKPPMVLNAIPPSPSDTSMVSGSGTKTGSKHVDATGDSEKGVDAQIDTVAGPDEFPDGGLDAWLVTLGSWLTMFCSLGYLNAFGVYQEYYQKHQLASRTPAEISWIGSIQFWLLLGMGCFIGPVFDRGYLRSIMIFGTVWLSFCLFMTSIARTYWQILLAQGVGVGIGLGLLMTPAVACMSHWFRRRRGLANGITMSGSSAGGVLFPIMINKMANNPSIGFAWAGRATAFIVLAGLTASTCLLKTRLPPKKGGKILDITVFKDLTYTTLVVGLFVILLGLYFPVFYIQSYAIDKGISPHMAFYSVAILNAASFFGRLIPNYFADIIGSFNVLIISTAFSTSLMFIFLAVHNTAGMVMFALAIGFSTGAYISAIPVAIAALTLDMRTIGNRLGGMFLVISFAALLGTPINGWIVARQSTGEGGTVYWGASLFSGICCAVGVGIVALARSRHAKFKGTWKV